MDSAALGMLLIVNEEADKAGGAVVLQNPVGQVKKMFDVSKFNSIFTIR